MAACSCRESTWKSRPSYRLSNGLVELTVLTGGGHIADFRLSGSDVNVLWEAPWETIDPETFSPQHEPEYGERPVGPFLAGYTGHAMVLGYFGMPTENEAASGLTLHGEAASSQWKVVECRADEHGVALTAQVDLPVYQLRFKREIHIQAGATFANIHETVTNLKTESTEIQWVQHAAFGPPIFTHEDAELFMPAAQAITWPLGYEGNAYLRSDTAFHWPDAPTSSGTSLNLARPFAHDGTGFVVSCLTDSSRSHGYAAVLNRKLRLVAGYCFDRTIFPWIALWEENRARQYPPWNGLTQVRGVEFGTSPMPLGLEEAQRTKELFGTPVFISIEPSEQLSTTYQLFVQRIPEGAARLRNIAHVAGQIDIAFER